MSSEKNNLSLIHQGDFEYPNLHNGNTSCFLELWQRDDQYVALLTEYNENKGTSITNQIDVIITMICDRWCISPDCLTVIEHYCDRHPNGVRGDDIFDEQFSLVTFERLTERKRFGTARHNYSRIVGKVHWTAVDPVDDILTRLPDRKEWPRSISIEEHLRRRRVADAGQ